MAAPESRPQERALPHSPECGHSPPALLWVGTSYCMVIDIGHHVKLDTSIHTVFKILMVTTLVEVQLTNICQSTYIADTHVIEFCTSYSGHGEELLGYWRELDRNLNVMATQYYTALRAIEEQQEGKYIEIYRGRGYERKRKGRMRSK